MAKASTMVGFFHPDPHDRNFNINNLQFEHASDMVFERLDNKVSMQYDHFSQQCKYVYWLNKKGTYKRSQLNKSVIHLLFFDILLLLPLTYVKGNFQSFTCLISEISFQLLKYNISYKHIC